MTNVARRTLASLQTPSFKENREYCGVIGIDPNGQIQAGEATRGRSKLCVPLRIPSDWLIIASYHTHGSYDPRAHSEVPSVQDMTSVASLGIVGYVSTPGGRFWFYDGRTETAQLICGPGCLAQDPLYRQDRPVNSSYTLAQLAARQDGNF